MTMLLNPGIYDVVNRAIIITGAARSGTTILSRLVGSLEGVEYLHEPPLLHSLLTEFDIIPESAWRLLYETYLFEDFLMDALAGRRINTNRNDQSSIYGFMREGDVEFRRSRSWRRLEIFDEAAKRRICFKIPDITVFIPAILRLYPGTTAIVVLRPFMDIIASLLDRRWYSDENLNGVTGIWPCHNSAAPRAPYWVPEESIARWRDMTEVERCVFHYITTYSNIPNHSSVVLFDYDRFTVQAKRHFGFLLKRLGCSPGPLTGDILASVRRPQKRPCAIPGTVPSFMIDRAQSLEKEMSGRAIN